MKFPFLGRQQELQLLDQLWEAPGAQFLVLYGRASAQMHLRPMPFGLTRAFFPRDTVAVGFDKPDDLWFIQNPPFWEAVRTKNRRASPFSGTRRFSFVVR